MNYNLFKKIFFGDYMVRFYIENLGPFEKSEIELKPLTIFVGKNSVGKSFLLYLLWTLASAEPAFEDVKSGWETFTQISEEILKKVAEGETPVEEFSQAVRFFHDIILREAVRIGLEERLKYVFSEEPKRLIKVGKEKALIKIMNDCAKLELVIRERVEISDFNMCIDEILKRINIEVPRKGYLNITYDKYSEKGVVVSDTKDVSDIMIGLSGFYMGFAFKSSLLMTSIFSPMLPDSRAGIARTLLKPYLVSEIPLGVDIEYRDLYFRLAEQLYKNPDVINIAKSLFDELGIAIETRFEAGVYNIYIKTWSGKVHLFSMAPSGVREILSVVLALALPRTGHTPFVNVFIEEPEAHLHPRALKYLSRLIVKAINSGKRVFITTHSDDLIAYINNLIIASRLSDEKLVRLGYSKEEVLDPSLVSVYLVKTVGDKAVVEPIEVSEDGISEDEFSRIAEELLGERGKIYAEM
jgi:predicted ATPase